MIRSFRISSLAWLAVLLGVLVFLGWVQAGRMQRVRSLSALGGGPAQRDVAAGAVEAGAAHGTILPHGLAASQHWVLQTQQMFSRREWRVRAIDYENAPAGRSVSAASPYRWWLGFVAWCDHWLSARPLARSVERAALLADPLLHGLLVLGTTLLVARRFGALSAALTAIGLAVTFPFAAGFVAGAPDDHVLGQGLALWSVLLLVAGVRGAEAFALADESLRRAAVPAVPPNHRKGGAAPRAPERERSAVGWFVGAGVVGGLGLWVDLFAQLLLLAGVAAGAVLAACIDRPRRTEAMRLPWRAWALGGAAATLVAYLAEFAPGHLAGWRLTSIHPLYALAWLGGGELLAQLTSWIRGGEPPRTLRRFAVPALAVVALAAPFVVLWKYQDRAAFIPDPLSFRLTRMMETVDARSLLVAVLPLSLAVPAVWMLVRSTTAHAWRISVAIVLGPLLVAVAFACHQLSWWSRVDGLLLVLLVAATAGAAAVPSPGFSRRGWSVLALVVLLPGLLFVVPRTGAAADTRLSRAETISLIERDLADWLARHSSPGSVIVLAPPNETTALCYYGGLRGVGSLSWENKDGVAAAVRILSAPSAQEAKELIDQRGITHLVLLSWDTYFDAYARAGTGRSEGTFRDQLKFPTLPRWLRPLPYQLPAIEGFEGQAVSVFAVVDEQDEATALTGVAGYLLEMGQLEQLGPVEQALQQFPGSLGAWVARAELQQARGDDAELGKSLDMLKRRLASKRPPALAWEQRVRLAILLGKAKELTLAREQVALCVEAADEPKLRALGAGTLYRLLVLGRHFDANLEPRLQAVALELLPTELRERLK